jgi:hypothetical protein
MKNSSGVYIPTNDLSQQMATIYFHLQNLAAMDIDAGAANVNSWPRDIGVAVRIADNAMKTNTAFYDGITDSMMFVPYTNDQVAIPINPGVIAHEHFHSLFYKIVSKDLKSTSAHDRQSILAEMNIEIPGAAVVKASATFDEDMHTYYEMAIAKGMNEGLADVWGWIYSGDPDFVSRSLPQEKVRRTLNVASSMLATPFTQAYIKQSVTAIVTQGRLGNLQASIDEYVTSFAYQIGNSFAKTFKAFADTSAKSRGISALEARQQLAKSIVKMLPRLHDELVKSGNGEYISPAAVISDFSAVIENQTDEEKTFLKNVQTQLSSNVVNVQ